MKFILQSIISIVFLSIITLSASCSDTEYNKADIKYNKSTGKAVEIKTGKAANGFYVDYHINGVKGLEVEIVDGRRQGNYREWYNTGVLKTEKTIKTINKNDKDEVVDIGRVTNWYGNGKKKIEYYSNTDTGYYNDYKEWYESGQLKSSSKYNAEGNRHGFAEEYCANGILSYKAKFNNGIKIDSETFYDCYGNTIGQYAYNERGLKNGLFMEYSRGEIEDSLSIEKPILVKKGFYQNGMLAGQFEQWHPNGALQFSGMYEANMKVGEWQSWDQKGILYLIEEYSEDAFQDRQYENAFIAVLNPQWDIKNRNALLDSSKIKFYLDNKYADLNKKMGNIRNWFYPIHIASEAAFDVLLEYKANISLPDSQLNTRLHICMELVLQKDDCSFAHAQYLINNIDPNALNAEGNTALHELVSGVIRGKPNNTKSIRLVKELIKAKSNLNIQNTFGMTPLMIALANNEYELAELMLEQNVALELTSASGLQAIHYMFFSEDSRDFRNGLSAEGQNILSLLMKQGANLNALTSNGKTIEQIYRTNGHIGMANYLEQLPKNIVTENAAAVEETSVKQVSLQTKIIKKPDAAPEFVENKEKENLVTKIPSVVKLPEKKPAIHAVDDKQESSAKSNSAAEKVDANVNLDDLLQLASEHYAKYRLLKPAGKRLNAVDTYEEIKRIAGKDSEYYILAEAGLAKVANRYLALAQRKANEEKYDLAAKYLQRAKILTGESLVYLAVEEKVTKKIALAKQNAEAMQAKIVEENAMEVANAKKLELDKIMALRPVKQWELSIGDTVYFQKEKFKSLPPTAQHKPLLRGIAMYRVDGPYCEEFAALFGTGKIKNITQKDLVNKQCMPRKKSIFSSIFK